MSLGNVRKLPSGRWQARYRVPAGVDYPPGLPRDVKGPTTFATRIQADQWLLQEARDLRAGLWVHPALREKENRTRAMTVGDAVEQWLEGKRVQVEAERLRASTFGTYAAIVENRILGVDGDAARLRALPIGAVTRADVAQWWEAVQRQFPRTAQRNWQALGKLREALDRAVEHEFIAVNPAASVKAPRPKTRRKRLPEDGELRAIVDSLPVEYRAAGALCLFHALRVGEALAVRVRDVQVEQAPAPWMPAVTIRVCGNFQRVQVDGRTTMVRQEPKTDAGRRDVPAFAEFVPLLLARRAVAARRGPDALLTATATGNPTMDTSFRAIFHRAREAAGVADDVTPHTGRDWLITRLAESGATPKEIGVICGQQDVSTILGVYMLARASRPAELMGRVAGVLDGPGGTGV